MAFFKLAALLMAIPFASAQVLAPRFTPPPGCPYLVSTMTVSPSCSPAVTVTVTTTVGVVVTTSSDIPTSTSRTSTTTACVSACSRPTVVTSYNIVATTIPPCPPITYTTNTGPSCTNTLYRTVTVGNACPAVVYPPVFVTIPYTRCPTATTTVVRSTISPACPPIAPIQATICQGGYAAPTITSTVTAVMSVVCPTTETITTMAPGPTPAPATCGAVTTLPPGGTLVQKYGQCGGMGFTGPTICAAGLTCTYYNEWYSQCL